MLTHNIQHAIIKRLVHEDELSFTDLKPYDLDNKLFTYHLKITIREGLVEKHDDKYRLTSTGRKLWKRIKESPENVSKRAHSVLYLIIRSKEHGWLLYTRTTHPLKDMSAFMHATPRADTIISTAASDEVREKTGLTCTFKAIGSGFFRTLKQDSLESFTNFTLLACENAQGELAQNDEHADYFWAQDPDFESADMLPNMKPLVSHYLAGEFPFFIDETVELRG